MSSYGVISDVHGNLAALRAVLARLAELGVARVVCLGDVVGYNAEPNECVAALDALGVPCVAGNHDLIALGRLGYERCSDKPAFALRRTRRTLSEHSRRVLAALPHARALEDDALLVHGGVADVCQYITTEARVLENHGLLRARHPRARVCFYGHTHAPAAHVVGPRGDVEGVAAAGVVALPARGRTWFVNPGSVDAARRDAAGARCAEFAVFDAARATVAFHRVAYDHGLAERLAVRDGYRMGRLEGALFRLARRGRAAVRSRARAALDALAREVAPW